MATVTNSKKKKVTDPKVKVKNKVLALFNLFGLESWTISWGWPEEDTKKNCGDDVMIASTDTDYEYKRIHIKFYPIFFTKSPSEQAETIIHELSHSVSETQYLIINDLLNDNLVTRREANRAREHETSAIQNIIIRLIDYGSDYFKKLLEL